MSKGDAEHEEALDIIKEICQTAEIPVIGAGNIHRMEAFICGVQEGCPELFQAGEYNDYRRGVQEIRKRKDSCML